MPTTLRHIFCLLAALSAGAIATAADALENGFRSPAMEDRPMVWWHWMNGSVTKEAIRAELEDMKRVGLAGAQMLDVTPGFTKETLFPGGPVRWGSDAWHEHWQYAIRTAAELGLKLGMMNCAGWSESGGPWVTPQDSMKKVVWSETDVTGGRAFRAKLAVPRANFDFYRDIAVLAVPADPAPEATVAITCSVAGVDTGKLIDGRTDADGTVAFPKTAENPVLTFTFSEPVERRLLTMIAPYQRGADVKLAGDIAVSDDGVNFRKVRSFGFPGYLFAHKGYLGSDLVLTAPFEPVRGRVWRVAFKGALVPVNIAEVGLSSAYRIENFQSKTLTSPLGSIFPPPNPLLADAAAIAPDRVLDLTANLATDGTLDWQPPAGRWTVLRFGYTTTGLPNHPAQDEGTGLEVDKMSHAALGRHFEAALGRILREAGPLKGTALSSLLSDSWEAAQQNWTADFAAEFRTRRGYDVVKFLPVLTGRVIESLADAEGFLGDFQRTCSDLIVENYFGELRRLANAHGLRYYGESYGGKTYNEFRAATQVEVNMGEFWFVKDRSKINVSGVKARASVAHTLGRTLVAAESLTATQQEAGWSAHPALLKPVGDLAFANGLNQMFLHSYVHQPYPALAPGFTVGSSGSNFGRLNTWWPRAGAWIDYLARCQFLLKQGDFVADVLLLKNAGVGGFGADQFPAVPAGFDFDEGDPLLLRDATVTGGRVRLASGVSYQVVALPAKWLADLATLRALDRMVSAGATVAGPAPFGPAGRLDPAGRAAWSTLIAKLWRTDGIGPRASVENDLAQILAAARLEPDCRITVDGPTAPVRYLHRRHGDLDIYFLATTSADLVRFEADFRVADRQPELWDAITGRGVAAPVFQSEGGRTKLRLALCDAGSVFVVFRAPRPAAWITAVTTEARENVYLNDALLPVREGGVIVAANDETWRVKPSDGRERAVVVPPVPPPVPIEGAWRVSFTTPSGKSFAREFVLLQRWTDLDDELRYFSGAAVYRKEFDVPAERLKPALRCLLELGAVHDLATVSLNGVPLGTWWTPPFSGDVTAHLKPGRNVLEIEVRNRWVNRLMGDDRLPQDVEHQQKLKTGRSWGIIAKFPEWLHDSGKIAQRQRTTFVTYQTYYKPEDQLPPSGLAGPVAIRFAAQVSLAGQ